MSTITTRTTTPPAFAVGDRFQVRATGRAGHVIAVNSCGYGPCGNAEKGGCITVVFDDATGADRWGLCYAGIFLAAESDESNAAARTAGATRAELWFDRHDDDFVVQVYAGDEDAHDDGLPLERRTIPAATWPGAKRLATQWLTARGYGPSGQWTQTGHVFQRDLRPTN